MADMEVMANDKATESTRKTHTSPNHEATTLGQLHCISWLVHMTDSHRYRNKSMTYSRHARDLNHSCRHLSPNIAHRPTTRTVFTQSKCPDKRQASARHIELAVNPLSPNVYFFRDVGENTLHLLII